jgi:Asp-tRNA(Asn)/Glu-tRNA(Gln) amidotransferase A subunit family amidase
VRFFAALKPLVASSTHCEIIVTPPFTAPAASASAAQGSAIGIAGQNVYWAPGLPGIVMPAGYVRDNMPVEIEFIGKSFDDLRLLQVAYGYEQATKKRKSPQITPPLPGEKFDY